MDPIIAPIDKRLIQMELTKDKFLKYTNKGDNELYIVSDKDAPNTMLEIGRLREITFRLAGGGTGKSIDIDMFDNAPERPYEQLIVWDPKGQEILGGYRFICTKDCNPENLATSELFAFSDKFQKDYMPYTIELGRSFVQPEYQSSRRSAKGLFTLDNLWDGLGGLVVKYPDVKYFFGKVTMYTSYNKEARNMLHYFMQKYFPDNDELIRPIHPLELNMDEKTMEAIFTGHSYTENYKILGKEIRSRGETIPPLINSYMSLSPTMKTFGGAINHEFGEVEETGILITIADIYPAKVERHIIEHPHPRLRSTKLNNIFRKK